MSNHSPLKFGCQNVLQINKLRGQKTGFLWGLWWQVKQIGGKDRVLHLIFQSVEKWRKVVFEGGKEDGPHDCPLCKAYRGNSLISPCTDCPIKQKTGRTGCIDTPYEEWNGYQEDNDNRIPYKVFDAKSQELALAEYRFLLDLYVEYFKKHRKDKPKEEPKEAWVDITKEIEWKLGETSTGFFVEGWHKGTWIVQITCEFTKNYRVEKRDALSFCVLRKA